MRHSQQCASKPAGMCSVEAQGRERLAWLSIRVIEGVGPETSLDVRNLLVGINTIGANQRWLHQKAQMPSCLSAAAPRPGTLLLFGAGDTATWKLRH